MSELSPIAPPFNKIFDDQYEADWALDFLRHTLDLLDAAPNEYRPVSLTLPKNHKHNIIRFNFGPWLLIDFSGPASSHGKTVHLALIIDNDMVDPRKKVFAFNHPHDKRGVAVYRFQWAEIKSMQDDLASHYQNSMYYTGALFSHWRGTPYRLAHQPQLFAAIFDQDVRSDLWANGLDPFYTHNIYGHTNRDEA